MEKYFHKKKTENYKYLAETFIEQVLINENYNFFQFLNIKYFRKIKETYKGLNFRNSKFIKHFKDTNPQLEYIKVNRTIGMGDLVLCISDCLDDTNNYNPIKICDVFTFENSLINGHFKFL